MWIVADGFTFAAMATQMHPSHESRVFGAAADDASLAELKRLELELLQDGHIGGLNGVLLGAAAEMGLRGDCLLGEIPRIFAQLPFPKASLAVLKVFTLIAQVEIDTTELAEQSQAMDQQLGELLAQVRVAMEEQMSGEEQEQLDFERPDESEHDADDQRLIEQLFAEAERDRAQAYELKRELDRLGVFPEYENRFLDLFKNPE